MTTKCVEPGEAVTSSHKYLVQVSSQDELLFPHVDSCIAIAFILDDGRLIGGHVGMQMPGADNLDPYGNAMKICAQMLELAQSAQVRKVILVGDANWENDFIGNRNVVEAIIQKVGCPDALFVDTGKYGGGVDFSLNPRRQMIFITLCKTNALVFQRPYAEIIGNVTKRL